MWIEMSNPVNVKSHKEYQDVLLNNRCLRHWKNRTHIKNHRIRTYEINKTLLSCFDNKIYIQNNGYEDYLLNIRVKFFSSQNKFLVNL